MTLRKILVCVFALALCVPVPQIGSLLMPLVGSGDVGLCGGDSCCCRPADGEHTGTEFVDGCDCAPPVPGDAALPTPGTPWQLQAHEVGVELPRPAVARTGASLPVPDSLRTRPEPPPPRHLH